MKTWKFGNGSVTCSLEDGSPLEVRTPSHPGMNFLLGEKEHWHQRPAWWGKGFLMTTAGSGRWDLPKSLSSDSQGLKCIYEPVPGIRLDLRRTFGKRWEETYRFKNTGKKPIKIGSLAISTPFRDVYQSSEDSLARACHAHLWTGGAHSYAWAWPMGAKGPGLGLSLKQGGLWSYSIESRTQFTFSNIRGNIYLHATDKARSPLTLGGQPSIKLKPGQSHVLSWELGWHDSFKEFEASALKPGFEIPELTAEAGKTLKVYTEPGIKVIGVNGSKALPQSGGGAWTLEGKSGEVSHFDFKGPAGTSRVGLLFHQPLRRLVETRVAYLMERQQAHERDPGRQGSFLPYDTQWGLKVLAGEWTDWSDGRERLAMPLLLQHALRLGWGDAPGITRSLEKFEVFSRKHLVKPDGSVLGESFHGNPERLYNFPWAAEFYMAQYHLFGRKADALLAARILENYYLRGGKKFLAFWDCAEQIISTCLELGQTGLAKRLNALVLGHAGHFLKQDRHLPRHEVNYEQSMVAPLVLLYQTAQRLKPGADHLRALARTMPWLEAFAGEQPHVRLRHVPIRHWDGYWFGRYRHWGDIFPHYWSVLSAAAYANAARMGADRDGRFRRMASDIFKANLASFHPDGSATCAFVYPGCVNGNPAHAEDPLANDQDWALVWYLKYPELW